MAMDGEALKKHSAELCEYISDFWENIREKAPLHHVKPGKRLLRIGTVK